MVKPIRPHDDESIPWTKIGDVSSSKEDGNENYYESSFRIHEPGSDGVPQLIEANHLPNAVTEVHAHEEDEIIYIVAGEMDLGGRLVGAGSSIFIAGNTLYGFAAGPRGLRFVNFRARGDDSFMTKDEFLARRARLRAESA